MKTIFILSLFFMQLFSASLEHVTLNNYDFSIVKESYDIYDSKGEVLKLYKEEQNRDLTFMLRFTLSDHTGGCAAKGMTEGSYELSDDGNITFYSMWTRQGKAYLAPYGARIQTYKVSDAGKLELVEGKIYLEETKRNHDNDSGMEYLFHTPKTEEEKKQLETYVKAIEEKYNATFVFGDDAKVLSLEVKKALKRKIKALWSR
jgi:Holliday junction resolvase RusA-like endonuclease